MLICSLLLSTYVLSICSKDSRGCSHHGFTFVYSPGSATDSAGSSVSISDGDMVDGHWEERYSHSPDESVIVEEPDSNMDDYAPWIGKTL